MLMLILVCFWHYKATAAISIHLMLMLILATVIGKSIFKHISIHLMLMLIAPYNHRTEIENIYFNTSHVNVNRESLDSTNQKKVAFQYISC